LATIRVGLVGVGKIARDQHIPVLRASPLFELVACASRHGRVDGIFNFPTVEEMLVGCPLLDAVVICSQPQMHYECARDALLAGKHVFLEKPPCATTAQLDHLAALARAEKRTLYQTWHLRRAPRVDDALHWLAGKKIISGRIAWKEDVRTWHPGQTWIWQAGGYGVFDPGINAISILTKILPEAVFVEKADLAFPSNCDSPITADLVFRTESGAQIPAAFDFLYLGEPAWDIELVTDGGTLKLSFAATVLSIDGKQRDYPPPEDGEYVEYAPLYRRFAELIADGTSEVDATPFRLVADAFLVGTRRTVAPFKEWAS
jgi:D-galactose 1-dehydrogenase